MTKSKASKIKAAGAMVGLNRNYESFRCKTTAICADNRATRRAYGKKRKTKTGEI